MTTASGLEILQNIRTLINPGIIGFHTHVEVTEIVAFKNGQPAPLNVFTIIVAEDRGKEPCQIPDFINSERIELKSLKGWSFGIMQYVKPIDELLGALQSIHNGEGWRLSGQLLTCGNLVVSPPKFVPPDSISPVPLNHVLKNNFWNGSHIFEWSDQLKSSLSPLFSDPRLLQTLSIKIQEHVPIAISALSDRVGNFIVQLPVTLIMSEFQQKHETQDFYVKLAWHPIAVPRPIRATCEVIYDNMTVGYVSKTLQGQETILEMPYGQGTHQGTIWDDENQIVLASTGPSAFINTIPIDFSLTDPEPRIFSVTENGAKKESRITLRKPSTKMLIGQANSDGWINKRMYQEQADKLSRDRIFIQYNAKTGEGNSERRKALEDLRYLINKHGQEGVWLWDPYLTTTDILETLFHCIYANADLRALTGSEVKQELGFDQIQSNWQGLNFEFRVSKGPDGWNFHDRFLIFPKTDTGALAWSLGTSVNSVGTSHHIVQKVGDGQLIMDAFLGLWERLTDPMYLIWKKP